MLIALLLFAAIAVLLINWWVRSCTSERILTIGSDPIPEADCILVLGAKVRDDGTPSAMLEDRIKVGIELYDLRVSDTLLMSGDHGRKDYDEVNCMKNYAVDEGVPAERIFLDHAGFSTYESLYRAREVFGAQSVVIVTQKYHLYRALYIADALGLDAVGVPADLRPYFGQIKRDVREAAARVKDFITSVVQPLPKYMGEPVSLAGDGSVTNG